MRKLASIEIIDKLEPIPNADRILKATIKGWECVVSKSDNFNQGDKVIYIEVDSILPPKPEFSFLKERKYRVKTIKLRKQISQGLVLPMHYLKKDYPVGTDVTKELGITKYDPQAEQEGKLLTKARSKNPIFKFMMRFEWFRKLWAKFHVQNCSFPTHIASKTDEERWQNLPKLMEQLRDNKTPLWGTEKVDGCFDPRSLVTTDQGQIRIGKIVNNRLPVRVLTYNEQDKCCEYKKILEYHKINSREPVYKIGVGFRGKGNRPKFLRCTANHQFLTPLGWKRADELAVGDKLYHYYRTTNEDADVSILNNEILETQILSIEKFEPKHFGNYMYDLTIEDNSNYFVHNILAHNCSVTVFNYHGNFGVCSRNIWLRKEDNSAYWEVARRFQLEETLKEIKKIAKAEKVVIQGEIIGQGIQKNRYKISGYDLYVYNIIIDGKKLNQDLMTILCKTYNLKTVPVLYKDYTLPETIQDLVNVSKGKSKLLDSQKREGIVWRNYEENISFKAINPEFLLTDEE